MTILPNLAKAPFILCTSGRPGGCHTLLAMSPQKLFLPETRRAGFEEGLPRLAHGQFDGRSYSLTLIPG